MLYRGRNFRPSASKGKLTASAQPLQTEGYGWESKGNQPVDIRAVGKHEGQHRADPTNDKHTPI